MEGKSNKNVSSKTYHRGEMGQQRKARPEGLKQNETNLFMHYPKLLLRVQSKELIYMYTEVMRVRSSPEQTVKWGKTPFREGILRMEKMQSTKSSFPSGIKDENTLPYVRHMRDFPTQSQSSKIVSLALNCNAKSHIIQHVGQK